MRYLQILFLGLFSITSLANEDISLSGNWDLVFDINNLGEAEEWFLNENFPQLESISVDIPSSWEEYIQNYEGVAWYRKAFKVTDQIEGKVVRLHFAAVNYLAEVYLNDEPIGYHQGGYAPFEFRIDDLLRYGEENHLILRVVSPLIMNDSIEIDGMTKWEAPHWRGALMAGIWQDVSLKIDNEIFTEDVFIEADIDGKVKLKAQVFSSYNENAESELHWSIKEKESGELVWQQSAISILEPGSNKLLRETQIIKPRLWSPESPVLYDLELSINKGESYKQTFGFREFVSREDGLYLNRKKFYMKAGFWEGLYPNKLGAPDSREMVIEEIKLAKEAGFNTLRPWRKPPHPMILELADEMGICMFGCPAIECMNEKPKAVPQMMQRVKNEVSAMVLRDRNHPSIIAWELFNEIVRNPLARIKHETVLLTRELDPTRAIIDESGGWANGARIYLPYSREAIPFNEIHSYSRAPVDQTIYDDYRHMGCDDYEEKWRKTGRSLIIPGAVTIVSEIGYGGFPDLESVMTNFKTKGNKLTPTYYSHNKLYTSLVDIMEPSGLQNVFSSVSELCLASQKIQAEGNKLQIEAARINPKIHGYCVHAYTAGDWVIGAGVLDIWRKPKQFYHTLVEVNKPLYFSARIEPANLYVGQKGALNVHSVNEGDTEHGEVVISLKNPKGKVFYSKIIEHEAIQGISSVLEIEIQIPDNVKGRCTMEVAFKESGDIKSTNKYKFDVYEKAEVKAKSDLVVIDYAKKIEPWLTENNISFSNELAEGKDIFILTSVNDLSNHEQIEQFRQVFKRVQEGATVCFLQPPVYYGRHIPWTKIFVIPETTKNRFYTEGVMPVKLATKAAKGRWDPINHAVTSHPYFKGLPVNEFMGQEYQNVIADLCLVGIEQKAIVPVVGWDYQRNHWGIRESWWGSDLTEIPYGKGKIIVTTLKIMNNLGKDPVADIILNNIISNN